MTTITNIETSPGSIQLREKRGAFRLGVISALSLLLCFGALFAPISHASELNMSIRYVGTGLDTAIDTNEDGIAVGWTQADSKGTFGKSTTVIVAEWALSSTVTCPAGYYIPLEVVKANAILTFPDQSQLATLSYSGWLCINPFSGLYKGEGSGDLVGGTGRFEGASGVYVTTFDGVFLDFDTGFRSIDGVIDGTVVLP